MLANADATEEMVQAAAEALKAAVDGLTEKRVDPEPTPTPTPSTKVDKTNLSNLYEQYKDMNRAITPMQVTKHLPQLSKLQRPFWKQKHRPRKKSAKHTAI